MQGAILISNPALDCTHQQQLSSKPSIAVLANSGTDEDSFDGDIVDDNLDKDAFIYVDAHDDFIYRTVP